MKRTDSHSLLVKLAREKMHEGIVRLTFIKADGTLRTAVATTSPEMVYAQTKSHRYWQGEDYTPFFDIKIGRWRSFNNDRLVSAEPLHAFEED